MPSYYKRKARAGDRTNCIAKCTCIPGLDSNEMQSGRHKRPVLSRL